MVSWLFLRKKLLRCKISFKIKRSVCIFGLTYMFTLVVLVQPHKWQFARWAKHFIFAIPQILDPSQLFNGLCCCLNIGQRQQKNQNKARGDYLKLKLVRNQTKQTDVCQVFSVTRLSPLQPLFNTLPHPPPSSGCSAQPSRKSIIQIQDLQTHGMQAWSYLQGCDLHDNILSKQY